MTQLGRVMLVDDEEFDRMIYERIIGRSGMADAIVSFSRATDALAYLEDPEAPPVHLILLDINMPGMTGLEFMQAADHLVSGDIPIPVIVMLTTRLAPSDAARAARHAAIRDYFKKPLTHDHLLRAAEIVRTCAADGKARDRRSANARGTL